MSPSNDLTTACECCKGITTLTPEKLYNRPGLSALLYRVGTQASFKATMLAQLSGNATLRNLSTRRDDDPLIALLDAWATIADVLTFYQERIANEGFLCTASERRSLLELVRTIGYELRPGVAASTYLTFTLDNSPGSPKKVIIPAGTRAQSLPAKEELPQTFETDSEIIARPAWNAIKPRLTCPQRFNNKSRRFYFKGTSTNLKPGDWMLLLARESDDPDDTGPIKKVPLHVVRVVPDTINQWTQVDLSENPPFLQRFVSPNRPYGQFISDPQHLTGANVNNLITQYAWRASDFAAFARMQGWPPEAVGRNVAASSHSTQQPKDTGVFVMRVKTAPFGNNAQKYETTPKEWRTKGDKPYERNWESALITTNSQGDSYDTVHHSNPRIIHLESTYPAIQKDSWIVLKSSTQEPSAYQVQEVFEKSLADYGLSAKTTGLTLDTDSGLANFKVRDTTIYAQSEKLDLVELPIEDDKDEGWDSLEIETMLSNPLAVGQPVIITGERADLEGVIESEVASLTEIVHQGLFTKLVFSHKLNNPYKRATVTINANLAPATHGETKQEVLGSGDASQSMQRFKLRQKPLTYISASVPSGGTSTLEVRVDNVLWHEAPDLYTLGPGDHSYIIRHNEDGKSTVLFGDGVHGARLPSGTENISAKYRVGIGFDGLVDAGQISLLQSKPLGVRSVNNPLASTGADDPEKHGNARQNAPHTVRTLDRIVSLQDFEDFARAFSGIGKACAAWFWAGEKRMIYVTIAAANGDRVPTDSALYKNLLAAMNLARDPFLHLRLESFQLRQFNVNARLRIHPDYEANKVLKAAEANLNTAFSYEARAFGQSVSLSEIMAVIQQVEGVEAVDVDYFHYSEEYLRPSLQTRLAASVARLQPDGAIQPAQLLTIAPESISLHTMS